MKYRSAHQCDTVLKEHTQAVLTCRFNARPRVLTYLAICVITKRHSAEPSWHLFKCVLQDRSNTLLYPKLAVVYSSSSKAAAQFALPRTSPRDVVNSTYPRNTRFTSTVDETRVIMAACSSASGVCSESLRQSELSELSLGSIHLNDELKHDRLTPWVVHFA